MLIYTHPLLYQVVNVQNLLALRGIKTEVRNQYASGAAGDLAINETWVELWLCDERDQAKALSIIESLNDFNKGAWMCSACGEENTSAFEICWHCQSPKDDTALTAQNANPATDI